MSGFALEREQTAGFVLAGGRSSRMGRDKSLTLFAGAPLIETALSLLRQAGIPARIAGFRSDLSRHAEGIPDGVPDLGPLGGVCSALISSSARWNVFLPVDMPLFPDSLLVALLQRAAITNAPITAAMLGGRVQPFPVVLERPVLPLVQRRLSQGLTACYQAWRSIPAEFGVHLDAVSVESMRQCGSIEHPLRLPPVYWFQGANTREELAHLERLVLRGGF
ncbi:molybdenum cofactor guanylyltransferase [Acidicapsa dinghuensis]|uniref:Molybdenum cofactor guanylyltransferase n=1 Tax=Acidicapsa dinghuensis TaxID=2218256 RepID=A0ABW1EMK0_9BACT|nr:molybdenum cofactor guanylyltransferase [Acidicapsa dinghuensis]